MLIGGRGSAKSESIGRFLIMKAQTEGADVLCGREFQSSIDDSVHKLLKGLIEDTVEVQGFSVLDQKIDCETGGGFRFKGFARNSSAVKSAQGFKYSWIEEAQTLSKESIRDLTPTIRAVGSQLYFTANPQASGDPFSKRFIVPYQRELDRKGYYEDHMHLIIVMNWRDNPWHNELEKERLWDLKHLPRAEYDHVWEGAFLDTVDNAIISPEWFDSCIDAHTLLGIEAKGVKTVTHDPSDRGEDDKGLCYKHGIVIKDVLEKEDLDVNEGCDWAINYALDVGADNYIWDCDGLGVTLRRQTLDAIAGKKIQHVEFTGSGAVEQPNTVFQSVASHPDAKAKTNKETFKNFRAQKTWSLRERVYKTHIAVNQVKSGKPFHVNPDELISFSSDITDMAALRSQVCRIPRVDSRVGLIQIMSKQDMKKLKPPLPSPNMFDCVMMAEATPPPAIANVKLNFASVY